MEISLLYPKHIKTTYQIVSDVTMHDLGFDQLAKELTQKETEQTMVLKVLAKMTDSAAVAKYRSDIFDDIIRETKMCEEMMRILDQINFLKDYGVFKKKYDDAAGIWDLMHRLEEMNEYIQYVEALYACLRNASLKSDGLKALRDEISRVYEDSGYAALKKDIAKLKATTSDLKSVTVGINLNERFEAHEIGLISINNKAFTKSGILDNFYDKINTRHAVHEGNEWDGRYHFRQIKLEGEEGSAFNDEIIRVAAAGKNLPIAAQLATVPTGDATELITHYMDRVTSQMLAGVVKLLRDVLNKYVTITITDITNLIPEFAFYIKFAEYIRKNSEQGLIFSKPSFTENEDKWSVQAKGIYNIKLVSGASKGEINIVPNDIQFDQEHLVYILTGANRGGKTTLTQAVGQMFVLAQAGIYVPGQQVRIAPIDCVYTHFPADEDQTLDLGRLGEECKRFKELYFSATENSLLLLNETFSTTSFEEGYYIAKDSVQAILAKGIRTLYNTHMHKLAYEIEQMNKEKAAGKAVSLVARTGENGASFQVEIAPPEGLSHARNIAEKYGVTYELLTK